VRVRFGQKERIMSRHHMLPPIIYPPPAPKRIEPKKRRLSIGMLDEIDETAEASETAATTPAPPAIKPLLAPMVEIENSASKPQAPAGRLSQDTMSALLRAQELN